MKLSTIILSSIIALVPLKVLAQSDFLKLPEWIKQRTKQVESTVLVADWPKVNWPAPVAEEIPAPVADPVPNFDELREIAGRLDKHAKDLADQAKELKSKEGLGSFVMPQDAACECNCDCPNAKELRAILREELA